MAASATELSSTARFFFSLSFSLSLLCCVAVSNAAGDEAAALLAIRASLVDPLGELRGWGSAPHCGWKGVSCNARGAVTGLNLAGMNLSGTVPEDVLGLTALTSIVLQSNAFVGDLPVALVSIPTLREFDVSDNGFTGRFPAGLGACASLTNFNASGNNFVGPLPADIGNATELETLDVRGGFFSGTIPKSYGKLQKLKFLGLSGNNLNGALPVELFELTALEQIIIGYNEFTGPIPAAIGKLKNLQYLDMAKYGLEGLGRLPHLQRLELAGNELSGEIPDDLALSTSLSFIDLSHNQLRSALPSNILSIPTLQTFAAADNELIGGVPDELGDCRSLSALDLSSNRLSGAIPTSLASCQRLVSLSLRSNRFTGQIPGAVAMMPTLSILDLSNNFLSGEIPSNFGSSPALEMLSVAYNNLTGPVPATGLLRTINPDDLAGNPGLCGGVLPACSANALRASSSEVSGLRRSHVKHIAAGWAIGISIALLACGAVFLGKLLYQRWYVHGCCDDNVDEDGSGSWPWRLTAFQRLSFTSAEVLACIKEDNIVGMGGMGVVYRAEMPRHHAVVAVKKLWRAAGCPDQEGTVDVESAAGGEFAAEELLDAGVGGRVDHVREEMLLVLRIAVLCTAKSPKDRPTMRDVVTMLAEAKPRRKSSSATVVATVVDKDKPVFSTSPDSGYL
uniref:LRR receptor-like serine/threonine-protein kinase RCH1 n=1 Tax=Aegilops tauschii TaxID=37682 RepID=M8CDF2_AEGTA